MDPEAEVSRFIYAQVFGARKMLTQVSNQHLWFGWLTESLMLQLLCQDADLPALLASVQSHINLLTTEVKSGILSLHDGLLLPML